MTVFQGVFLGLVQGLTEFLPVSSSGHLVLFQKLFGFEGDFLFFNLILHLATLLAVLLVFRKTIFKIIKQPFGREGKLLLIGCIPTVVLAFGFKIFLGDFLSNPPAKVLSLFFFISAVLLLVSQIVSRNVEGKKLNNKTAFAIGVFQGLAVFPGISRSGATISSGLIFGGEKTEVSEYSFLLSIPIILGGFVLEVFEFASSQNGFAFISALPTALGFVVAFVSGLFAIKFMMRIIKKANLMWFSLYLVFVSIISAVFIK